MRLRGPVLALAIAGLLVGFNAPASASQLSGQVFAITTGSDGNVWFSEHTGTTAAMIGRISPAGELAEFTAGLPSTAWTGRVTLGPDGNVWFTDEGTPAGVGKITPTGAITWYPLPDPNGEPDGIVAGPDGNLWVHELFHIARVTTSGAVTEFDPPLAPGVGIGGSGLIAVGGDGNLWFNGLDVVGRATTAGTITLFPPGGTLPIVTQLTRAPDGSIWYIDERTHTTVTRMATDGSTQSWPVAGAQSLQMLSAGSDGNIWFSDASGFGKLSATTGAVLATYPISHPSTFATLSLGPDGNVWFPTSAPTGPPGTPAIGRITPDGVVTILGTPGPPIVSAPTVQSESTRSATVAALVNPNGSATTYHVEWGSSAGSYPNVGPTLPPSALVGSTPQVAAGALTGLTPSQLLQPPNVYHWRIVATNASGSTASSDATAETRIPIIPIVVVPPPPPCGPIACVLNGGGSSGGSGSTVVSYGWDWGNGVATTCPASSPLAFHLFAAGGTYNVTLTVTNAAGGVASATVPVTVSAAAGVLPKAPGLNASSGGCQQIVNGTLCTTRIEWPLITADVIPGTCFEQRTHVRDPGWQTCVICAPLRPAGRAHAAAATGCLCVPLPSGMDNYAKLFGITTVWTAESRTPGADASVNLNGMEIDAHPVTVGGTSYPGQVVIDPYADIVAAYSADTSVIVPGGGQRIPLSRNTHLSATFPDEFAPPVVTGSRVRVANHRLAGAATNPCDDASVGNAPTLAQFTDPSQSNIPSSVEGFSISGGPVTVHVVDNHLVICVDIAVPSFAPCSTSPGGISVKATLLADPGGLVLQNLRARMDCAVISDVTFTNVYFAYDQASASWAAGGTVSPLPVLALHGDVMFSHAQFQEADISVSTTIPLGPLSVSGLFVQVTQTRVDGGLTISTTPIIPYLNVAPVSLQGTFAYVWSPPPKYIEVRGTLRLFGASVADGYVRYYSDNVMTAHVQFDAGIKDVFSAKGAFDGAIWSCPQTSAPCYSFDLNGSISVLDLFEVSGEAALSYNGGAACVLLSAGPFSVHVGAGIHWSDLSPNFMWSSCGVGPYTAARPRRPQGAAHAAATTSYTLTVARGTPYEVIGATGPTPPAVTVTGPGGVSFMAPATGHVVTAASAYLHDPAHGTTFVIIRAPRAGTWTVTPASGSVITSVRDGTTRPVPVVHATVSGSGVTRHLAYTETPVAGQRVRFFEQVRGRLLPIGSPVANRRGTITFRPAGDAARARTIIAVVETDGIPSARVVAGRYTFRPAKPLAAPRHLAASRKGTTVTITWNAVHGAAGYLLSLRTTDGRLITRVVTRRRYVLRGVDRRTRIVIVVVPAVSISHGVAHDTGRSARLVVKPAKP